MTQTDAPDAPDAFDAQVALGVADPLRAFNQAGILSASDVQGSCAGVGTFVTP